MTLLYGEADKKDYVNEYGNLFSNFANDVLESGKQYTKDLLNKTENKLFNKDDNDNDKKLDYKVISEDGEDKVIPKNATIETTTINPNRNLNDYIKKTNNNLFGFVQNNQNNLIILFILFGLMLVLLKSLKVI